MEGDGRGWKEEVKKKEEVFQTLFPFQVFPLSWETRDTTKVGNYVYIWLGYFISCTCIGGNI